MIELIDRFLGCFLGLAIGDALGAPVEFQAPGTFDPITDMRSGGVFKLQPGQWTDDTSLALCLADSLIEQRNFDLRDQISRFIRWYREGYFSSTGVCFDIGNTTKAALEDFEKTGVVISKASADHFASNGSIMRLAPVPMTYFRFPDLAIEYAGESSRTTHSARVSVDACRYLGALIWGALNGASKNQLLGGVYEPIIGYWTSHPLAGEIELIANGSFRKKNPPDIVAGSRSDQCLEASLWAFYHGEDYREGCLLAVNLGNDTDTAAAVFGQLAGAYYGIKAIPAAWLDALSDRDLISQYAAALLKLALEL